MRHQKKRNKLSRDSGHRKALVRNLCAQVIQHERVKTTEAKAKVVKPEVEKLITLAKRGDLHARRQALADAQSGQVHRPQAVRRDRAAIRGRPGRLHADPQAGAAALRLDGDGLPRARLRHALKLTLEYDGREFAGWAAQPGLRTVEGIAGGRRWSRSRERPRGYPWPAAPTRACMPGDRSWASTVRPGASPSGCWRAERRAAGRRRRDRCGGGAGGLRRPARCEVPYLLLSSAGARGPRSVRAGPRAVVASSRSTRMPSTPVPVPPGRARLHRLHAHPDRPCQVRA